MKLASNTTSRVLHFLLIYVVLFTLQGLHPVKPVYAAYGDFDWAKGIGGTGNDYARAIAVDSSGDVYIAGAFEGTVDFNTGLGTNQLISNGFQDIFVAKYDSNGNYIWAVRAGSNHSDAATDIVLDIYGNIYITGYFNYTVDFDPGGDVYNLTSNGGDEIFILKLNSMGEFIWAKSIGANNYDSSFGIASDGMNAIVLTGLFSDAVDFDPGPGVNTLVNSGGTDIFVLKMDYDGSYLWAKGFGGTWADHGLDITTYSDGTVYATGSFSNTVDFDPGAGVNNLTSAGAEDVFVLKLSGQGNFIWARNMGGANEDIATAITTNESGVYLTGYFYGQADFDPTDGTYNLISVMFQDIFITKMAHDGSLIWAKSIGGNRNYDQGMSISLDKNGDVYSTGIFYDVVDFNPGSGTAYLSGNGYYSDIYIVSLDGSGNFKWAKQLGGSSEDGGYDITVAGNGIYTTGYFRNTVDFDPGTGSNTFTSNGIRDIFINKLENAIIYVNANAEGSNNGTSWTDAYEDLQTALSAASSGQEIWVAAGTYKPTPGTDRSISFVLKNGVAIYGGFAGTETAVTSRNPKTHVTILSGDIGIPDDASDNSARVVKSEYIDNTAVLDGFTITKGAPSGPYDGAGGGMHNSHGSPTLRNLIFTNNVAGIGSAMYNENSSPILVNVVFSNNTGTPPSRGGAMVNDVNSSPHLTNVTFVGNRVTYLGGAMLNSYNSNPILENVTFYDNASTDRGGAIYNWASNPVLKNVTFSGNNAPAGGAIYNDNNSMPTIVNTILYGDGGGEIYNYSGTATVTYSIVQGGYPGTGNKNADPLLGPLANNGGVTQTMALLPGSPAIDAGNNSACPSTDQRGTKRPQGAFCDIGAFEYIPFIFTDVPFNHWAWSFIESLYKTGVTSGCGTTPMLYCPTTTVTRDQMAVFLLRAKHGSSYSPPAAKGVFQDVPTSHWAAPWIEQLAAEGITGGCSTTPKLYCPATPVTRDQMAVFLLRAKHGSSYGPPLATGVFQDVATDHWAAAWIERLAAEGITGGCSTSPMQYCPTTPVSRDQMAVFLVRTFNLP